MGGKRRTAYIFIFIAVLLVFVLNVPALLFWEYDGVTASCVMKKELSFVPAMLYPWLTTVLFVYSPILVIVISNAAIIKTLLSATRERKTMTTSSSPHSHVCRIAVTISVVSVIFVILEMGSPILRTKLAAGNLELVHPPPRFFVGMMACQTNHGINFLLYCWTGKPFRKELVALLSSVFCIKAPNKFGSAQKHKNIEMTDIVT